MNQQYSAPVGVNIGIGEPLLIHYHRNTGPGLSLCGLHVADRGPVATLPVNLGTCQMCKDEYAKLPKPVTLLPEQQRVEFVVMSVGDSAVRKRESQFSPTCHNPRAQSADSCALALSPQQQGSAGAPRLFRWGQIAALVLLVLAPASWFYGYYHVLRVVVTAVACYGVWLASRQGWRRWRASCVVIAAIFNPIIPIHLSRDTWAVVDLVVAAVLLFSVVGLRRIATASTCPAVPDVPSESPQPLPPAAIEPSQSPRPPGHTVVGNSISMVYHRPSCEWAQRMSQENQRQCSSKKEARGLGYHPCRSCQP